MLCKVNDGDGDGDGDDGISPTNYLLKWMAKTRGLIIEDGALGGFGRGGGCGDRRRD